MYSGAVGSFLQFGGGGVVSPIYTCPGVALHPQKSVGSAMALVDPAEYLRARGNRRNVVLSGREDEILALVHQGLGDKAIALRLGVSARTIRTHMEHIFRKWDVHNRYLAARMWLSLRPD